MLYDKATAELETKFCRVEDGLQLDDADVITGYASIFGATDQGGDIVAAGAYAKSLERLKREGRAIKMLWQHDPAQPIGVWDEVCEDGRGLAVKGRLLAGVQKGAEAKTLLAAGAIDGLSIGYRTLKAEKDSKGRRLLQELELWEVSLVTFPMLREARVQGKDDILSGDAMRDMASVIAEARARLADIRGR